ncbi:MAG TPA: PDZ domain-containing protein [bacterium]|nr:PDZ domain-containing protein [bacterium]
MKSFKSIGILVAVLSLGTLLSGCGNPYRENYLSTLEKRNKDELSRLLPPSHPPTLVTSNDLKDDSIRMRENGYLLIGRSKFHSAPVDERQALDQAKQVGAEVVLVNHKYVNSVTESVPMSEYIPGQQVSHQETTVVQQGDATPTVIQKQSNTTVQGEFHTTFVDQNVDYYEYAATFWAKAKPSLLGVLVKALDDKAKAQIGSNKGVLVRVVVKDSPAYDADILRDDILLNLGGEVIRDPDQFFDLVQRNEGKEVPLILYRAGQELTVNVKINNE